jgi:SAM-dependent methyltransferase
MTPEATRARIEDLYRGVWATSALSVAASRGVLARLQQDAATIEELAHAARLQPSSVSAICGVLIALGLARQDGERVAIDEGLRAVIGEGALGPFADDVFATFAAARAPVHRAAAELDQVVGWDGDDAVLVRAQGRNSVTATKRMNMMVDMVPGLRERLTRPGATMLDVGSGAAGLCLAYAQMFPALRIVGLEPSATAIAEGRAAVAASGLGERIELRQQYGEQLSDDSAFTMAWVAQMFVPDDAIMPLLRSCHRALEPGGVLVTAAVASDGDDLGAAISRWRNAAWGGSVRTAAVVKSHLEASGFVGVAALPGPPGGTVTALIAHR